MAGLIDQAQPEAPAEEKPIPTGEPTAPDATGNPQGPAAYHSKVIEAVPPAQQEAFARLVEAGRKILYSDQMAPEVQKALSGNKPMWQKLGEGVSRLMMLIDTQSGKTAPHELLIPAGIELVSDLGQGLKVSDEDLKLSQVYFSICMMKVMGAPDDQIQSLMQKSAQPGQPSPTESVQPTPPQQTEQPA